MLADFLPKFARSKRASNDETAPAEGERRDLRRGALQLLSGSGARVVARILMLAFVARMYGIDDFGRLGETVAMVELSAVFATFGLSKTLLGRLSAEEDPARAPQHIMDAATLAGTLALSLTAILWLAWPYLASSSLESAQFVLLGIPLIALAEVATTATRHHRTAFWDTVVKGFVKPWSFLLLSIVAFYGLYGGGDPDNAFVASEQALLLAYLGSLVLAAVAATLALLKAYRPKDGESAIGPLRLTRSNAAALAKRSWPIALNDTGLFAFRRIDVIILAAVVGPKETAIYFLARQIGTVVEKIRHLFEPVLAPIIAQSRSLETIGAHLNRLGFFIFAAQLTIICVLAVFGGTILTFFGKDFTAGLLVLLVILVGELLDGSFGLCELPMVYRHPAWPPRLVLGVLAFEVVLVWFLAVNYGALGAAAGFAAAMLALAILRIWAVRSLYGFKVVGLRHLLVASLAIGIVALASDVF